jgi:hypothetical protein
MLGLAAVLRIRDVYPRSRILIYIYPRSRISDPKQQQKRRGKIFFILPFFVACKYRQIEPYFIFEMVKRQFWAKLQRFIEFFTQKIVIKLSKIWYGIRDPEKTYSGSQNRSEKSTGSQIPDPQHSERQDPDLTHGVRL